jgi:hypothetical protein
MERAERKKKKKGKKKEKKKKEDRTRNKSQKHHLNTKTTRSPPNDKNKPQLSSFESQIEQIRKRKLRNYPSPSSHFPATETPVRIILYLLQSSIKLLLQIAPEILSQFIKNLINFSFS